MMLIDGKDEVFFCDRDNCLYKVTGLTFLHRKDKHKHIADTLLDGEMVIDVVNGVSFPRFLIYDIIRYEGNEVGVPASYMLPHYHLPLFPGWKVSIQYSADMHREGDCGGEEHVHHSRDHRQD